MFCWCTLQLRDSIVLNSTYLIRFRMSHQQILINGNGTTAQTLQHYLMSNHIPNSSDHQNQNVQVQIVKQEQAQQISQQRFIINRQYLQQNQNQTVQVLHQQELQIYWLIVDIESNNELNTYALVESKDVVGLPPLESLGTGKLVIVNINGKQRRATVVISSSIIFLNIDEMLFSNLIFSLSFKMIRISYSLSTISSRRWQKKTWNYVMYQ